MTLGFEETGATRQFTPSTREFALREQVADLEAELRAAQVREEIALVLPRAVRGEPEAAPSKPMDPKVLM